MNQQITESIWELEKGNNKLRDQAKQLQTENRQLRKALVTVRVRAGAAGQYINKTLDDTDDLGDASLKILDGEKEKGSANSEANHTETDDNDDTDASSDADAGEADADPDQDAATDKDGKDADIGQSLIALRSQHRALRGKRVLSSKNTKGFAQNDEQETEQEAGDATEDDDGTSDSQVSEEQDGNADDNDSEVANATYMGPHETANDRVSQTLVHSLSEELQQLDKQDVESRKHMSEIFEVELSRRKKTQADILLKQRALNGTRASLTDVQGRLQSAVHRLESTRAQLQKRFHGLGEYLQRLAAFVSEPAPRAESTIPSLPSDVAAFLQESRRARGRTEALPVSY